jgi:hypothetical protein
MVFLFGVPFWRPPRRSPGLDPLGMATFAISDFWRVNERLMPVGSGLLDLSSANYQTEIAIQLLDFASLIGGGRGNREGEKNSARI